MENNYHLQLINEVNTLKTRNYYHLLNEDKTEFKEFKFEYFKKEPEDILNINPSKNIKVPSCIQILGYDANQYTNVKYPFPYNPPYIDKDIPCCIYVTNYNVDDLNKIHYLNLDGVDSCAYVYVNKKFVGYQTVSHSNSEYKLNDYLNIGDNEIRIIVFKWCAMSYLEDQDKLRMTGIFRDAYIIRRNKEHIHDYRIIADYDHLTNKGTLHFECNKKCNVSINGVRQDGKSLDFVFDNIKPWSAENPNLYEIMIKCNKETIIDYVGFRRIYKEGNVLKLNGKPIKFKGVNRHSSTVNGYVETIKDLIQDIKIMKEHNINAIRTSHYPCHKELPYLCDKYGIYLMEEADIECHGVVFKSGAYSEQDYNEIANLGIYDDAICYRQEKMVLRDINRPSILIWSLGNESGWGNAFKKASKVIKKLDNTRLIHYERTWLGGSLGKRDKYNFALNANKYVDMYSRMYPTLDDMKLYGNKLDLPFILCEYSHAMGNSCGDLNDYEELIEKEIAFCGGFIWEFINHSIKKGNKYFYGGDFKDIPNDSNFCMDGLVGIDRKLFPEIKDVKNIFSLVKIKKELNDNYVIYNNYSFTSLDDFDIYYYFEKDGIKVSDNIKIDSTNIEALSNKKIHIEYNNDSNSLVTINFIVKKDNLEIYKKQFILKEKSVNTNIISNNIIKIDDKYVVSDFIVDSNGMIIGNTKDKELIKEPSSLIVDRAYIDNDRNLRWYYINELKLHTAKFHVHNTYVNENCVSFIGSLDTDLLCIANVAIAYFATDNGLKVLINVNKNEKLRYFLPRFGYSLVLNDKYNKCFYLGYGPNEAYIDKHQASTISNYSFDVFSKDNFFDYPYPQESGSHYNTYNICLTNGINKLSVSSNLAYSFQAIPFKTCEIKDHAYKLNYNSGHTILNIDYMMSGVGSNSCGPFLLEKYQLNENEFGYEFYLKID